jgi:biopolymer transport protein TolR
MITGGGIEPRHGPLGRRYRPLAEINVTPFVDVMLVLLIVFMVTAPLLTVGVTVDLPKTKASAIPGADEPLTITVDADGRLFLQETELPLDTLVPRLNAITQARKETAPRIFIRGDRTIGYGRVMEVMGTINAAGYTRVALVTEKPESSGTKTPKAKTKASKADQ